VPVGHHPSGLLTFAAIYILGRAFANGGSSLTGIEAVSNAVSALRPPEGRNARQLLATQGAIVAFLIAGISWLAHLTHAVPYVNGFPTVLSQEAALIFGQSTAGKVLYFLVQAGAISILFTGGNTSFSGFPFLTSFVAEDSFLPRWLPKRGHRLVFSNGILVLTVLALALLLAVGANTNNLVPFYAIGVFTGFAMAGFGMARYHRRAKEPAWRRRLVINFTCGVYTALVVVIFAVVKFTEGAWLVVAVFPVMVFLLIRLNRQYRSEAGVVEALSTGKPPDPPNYLRRTVLVLVDDFDLAAIAALRYAQPAPHHAARGALRHRPATRRPPAGPMAAHPPGHSPRPRGLPAPADRPGGRRTRSQRGLPARQPRHRAAATAQHPAAARPAPARPDRRQNRRRGEPDPPVSSHDHPLRRNRPDRGLARASGQPQREREARPG
jgi:hypothetical protein